MAEISTIARPYARAVFEIAQEQGKLGPWSEVLANLAQIMAHEGMAEAADATNVNREVVAGIVIELGGSAFNTDAQNLVKVLAENRRLTLAAEIAAQYEVMRADAENTLEAELRSAQDVSDDIKQSISKALEKRLGRKVNLVVTKDETVIGGAVVKAGDLVIDGSAAGRLQKLTAALVH